MEITKIYINYKFSAVCLHFVAVYVEFAGKTSAIKSKWPQFSQKCGKLVKTEACVLASKVNIPDFFQLIMKIYTKIDF